jgi:hypothetical protein
MNCDPNGCAVSDTYRTANSISIAILPFIITFHWALTQGCASSNGRDARHRSAVG